MAKSDVEALNKFIDRVFPQIRDDVEIVEVSGSNPVYHISCDKNIKEFVPMVSNRTMGKEDRSVPRVSVAPSVIDCLNGYSKTLWDFLNGEIKRGAYHGGYYIYELPVKVTVIPSKKLVPDAGFTREQWVLGYNDETTRIVPNRIGKFFIHSLMQTANGIHKETEYLVYFNLDTAVQISQGEVTPEGCWKMSFKGANDLFYKKLTVQSITKSEFNSIKKASAELLCYKELPKSVTWAN